MSLQRVARAAVLLAAVTALVGILLPGALGSGWLTAAVAFAWIVLALVALLAVRRRYFVGELLIAVLAIGPGAAFLLRALGNSVPSVLDAAQTLLMATALVLFALDRRRARSDARAEVPA